MVSALGALHRQISDLIAENLSLKKPNQKLMQNFLSASHKSTAEKLNRLSATILTGTLGISLKADQRLAF